MRVRRVTALLSATFGLVLLSGCGGDEEPSARTTPAASVGGASDEPTEDSPDSEPSIEVPTDLPTDASDLGIEGECGEIVQVLLDAGPATEAALSDPTASGDLFAQLGQSLRDAASGVDDDAIAAAAEDLADVYDQFGPALESGETAQLDDLTAGLTAASTALQEACT